MLLPSLFYRINEICEFFLFATLFVYIVVLAYKNIKEFRSNTGWHYQTAPTLYLITSVVWTFLIMWNFELLIFKLQGFIYSFYGQSVGILYKEPEIVEMQIVNLTFITAFFAYILNYARSFYTIDCIDKGEYRGTQITQLSGYKRNFEFILRFITATGFLILENEMQDVTNSSKLEYTWYKSIVYGFAILYFILMIWSLIFAPKKDWFFFGSGLLTSTLLIVLVSIRYDESRILYTSVCGICIFSSLILSIIIIVEVSKIGYDFIKQIA